MKAEELQIFDWVSYKGNPIMVFEIDEPEHNINTEQDGYNAIRCISIDEIQPIPITPEILLRNGFVEEKVSSYYDGEEPFKLWTLKDGCISITINLEGSSFDVFNGNIVSSLSFYNEKIFYLHQLQQAMRLCGIEKEITLN